jgi:hypothetical protein
MVQIIKFCIHHNFNHITQIIICVVHKRVILNKIMLLLWEIKIIIKQIYLLNCKNANNSSNILNKLFK